MTFSLRLVLVASVLVAVLPVAVAYRPVPVRLVAVRGERAAKPVRASRGPPPDARHSHRLRIGCAILAGAGFATTVGVVATLVLSGALAGLSWATARAAARRRAAALAADVPDVADLLVVAVGAGLSVPQAIAAVGRRGSGPLAALLADVADDAAAGRRLADALDELPRRAGEASRPLAGALLSCVRDGAPVGPTLSALAAEARDHERRRVEQAARRVPVLLLFPLVLCVLPAFALLTVAPLIADALAALRL